MLFVLLTIRIGAIMLYTYGALTTGCYWTITGLVMVDVSHDWGLRATQVATVCNVIVYCYVIICFLLACLFMLSYCAEYCSLSLPIVHFYCNNLLSFVLSCLGTQQT